LPKANIIQKVPFVSRQKGLFVGVFRYGNKPPVLPGENKKSGATIERASKKQARKKEKRRTSCIIEVVWRPHY